MSFFPDESLGLVGSAPPTVATFVAGTDGTDLRGIAVDATGKQRFLIYDASGNPISSSGGALDVNIGGGLANPLPTTDAADGTTGAAVPAKAILAGGSDGTNLRAFATDTTGRQKVTLYDAAGNALTSTAGALNVNVTASAGTVDENLIKLAGTAIDVNSGTKSAGTQRIVIATDQPQLTNALKVDGSAVTQPISAAALPLPAGASTAAKQPAIGTAGTPSADVITVQGHSGMTAVDVNITGGGGSAVDESAFTAGTSVFTPEGGVFNDSAAALTSGQQGTGRQTPNRARHANLRNQAGTELATSSNPLRVDPTGTTKQPVTLFDAAGNALTSTSSMLDTNLGLIGGAAVDKNSGAKSAGTQRVVIATDQPAFTNPMPVKEEVFYSGDTLQTRLIANRCTTLNPGTTGATTTIITGSVGYFVSAIQVSIEPNLQSTTSGNLLISFKDSSSGLRVWWYELWVTTLATPVAGLQLMTINTPPGWFYNTQASGSLFQVSLTGVTLNQGSILITVCYGLTAFLG